MIHIFNHYVPGRLIALAVLEALVLLIAAYVGISLHTSGSGAAIAGTGTAVPSQALAFAVGMMTVISSMGLYQSDLSNNQAVRLRFVAAFLLGFAILGLVSYLAPSLNPGPAALGGALAVALAGSVMVRAAFHSWNASGMFKSRVLVLGTGSRVMKIAEYAGRNPNHRIVGYVAPQPGKHYIPLSHVLSLAPGESLLSIVKKYAIDQIVVAVRD